MNIKKAFTFAELMISLVIIAIVTAILYPTISELTPNNNGHLFKATYKTIEMVISEIVNSPNNATVPQTGTSLCTEFEDRLNITGETNCNNRYLQTSNGTRWQFSDAQAAVPADPATGTAESPARPVSIIVDVNASNNNIHNANFAAEGIPESFNIGTAAKPVVGSYMPNNLTARDTFIIHIQENGKITTDKRASQHLQGETE